MAKSKSTSLLDTVRSAKPHRKKCWFDNLSPDIQQQFLDLRAEYHGTGTILNSDAQPLSLTTVYNSLRDVPGICGESAFLKWMKP